MARIAALEVGHGLGLTDPHHAVERLQLLDPCRAATAGDDVLVDIGPGVLPVDPGGQGLAGILAAHGRVVAHRPPPVPE